MSALTVALLLAGTASAAFATWGYLRNRRRRELTLLTQLPAGGCVVRVDGVCAGELSPETIAAIKRSINSPAIRIEPKPTDRGYVTPTLTADATDYLSGYHVGRNETPSAWVTPSSDDSFSGGHGGSFGGGGASASWDYSGGSDSGSSYSGGSD